MSSTEYRVVIEDIPLGDPGRGVYAYRKGDKVLAAAVKENGWDKYVATVNSQSAQQAVAEATGTTRES